MKPDCYILLTFPKNLELQNEIPAQGGKYDTNRITEAGESGNTKTGGKNSPDFSVMVKEPAGKEKMAKFLSYEDRLEVHNGLKEASDIYRDRKESFNFDDFYPFTPPVRNLPPPPPPDFSFPVKFSYFYLCFFCHLEIDRYSKNQIIQCAKRINMSFLTTDPSPTAKFIIPSKDALDGTK